MRSHVETDALGFTGRIFAPGPETPSAHRDLTAWLARHGLDADDVAEVEIRPFTVRARVFDRNLQGKRYVRPDGQVADRWVTRLKRTLFLPPSVVVAA